MQWHAFVAAAVTFGSVIVFGQTAAHAVSGEPLFAVLLGGNEVNAAGVANSGDPDGIGSATVTIRGTTLCYGITVFGIAAPTLAHIHNAPAGVNGGIVVNLVPPAAGNPGTSSGCVGIPAALASQIRALPNEYYVNIHNAPFPSGALRGQLE